MFIRDTYWYVDKWNNMMSWICFRIVWGSGLKVSVSELRLTSWQLLMLGDGYIGGNYAGLLKLKSWVLV